MDTKLSSRLVILWVFYFHHFVVGEEFNYTVGAETKLRDELFLNKRYDPTLRPVQHHNSSVVVEISMDIARFDLDETEGILTTNAWLRLKWEDRHFSWEPGRFQGLEVIHVPDNLVWKPDIYLYNSARMQDMQHYGTVQVLCFSDGVMVWFPPATFHSSCVPDHTYYPFDEQICSLSFGSWVHDTDSLDLQLWDNGTDKDVKMFYQENSRWELCDVSMERVLLSYDCCNYSTFHVTVHLRRRAVVQAFLLLVPLALIMVLSLVPYWLHPGARERSILGGLSLILIVLLFILLGQQLPNGGTGTPAVVLISCWTLLLSALAVIEAMFTKSLSEPQYITSIPTAARRLVYGLVGRTLCLRQVVHQQNGLDSKLLEQGSFELGVGNHDDKATPRYDNCTRDWLMVAAMIDRVFFIIHFILYLIIILVCYS